MMNKFYKFVYYLGYYSSYASDFFSPKATWLLPFLLGIALGYYANTWIADL